MHRLGLACLPPLAAAVAILLPVPADAQRAVDGDTLKLGGVSYRLHGIDAPEIHQACDAGAWLPGPLARNALAALITGQVVNCMPVTRDRYGRTVARCYVDGQDLGARMVADGWAWAFTRYSLDYAGLELAAIDAARGVHSHRCQVPADYRADRRTKGTR